MQLLCYRPASASIFYFPIAAVLKVLERHIDRYGLRDDRQLLYEIVQRSKTCAELIALDTDFRAAAFVRNGRFTVYCSACDTHFSAAQCTLERWNFFHSINDAGGGLRLSCSLGHELLCAQDWQV